MEHAAEAENLFASQTDAQQGKMLFEFVFWSYWSTITVPKRYTNGSRIHSRLNSNLSGDVRGAGQLHCTESQQSDQYPIIVSSSLADLLASSRGVSVGRLRPRSDVERSATDPSVVHHCAPDSLILSSSRILWRRSN